MPALAWSNIGHQSTGAIAWTDLKARHPAELAELLELIRQHPDYPRFAPAIAALSPEMQQRALFEALARWPDDIRGGPEDRPDWHYQLRVVSGRTWLWPFQNGNAAFGFGYNFTKLSNHCAPAAERAKAIGWIIHIVGDVQQPLHAGHQMSANFPMTDRAGQSAWVKRPNGVVKDLHQYWDQTLDDSGVALPAGQSDWANALIALWPRQKLGQALPAITDPGATFAGYLDESAALAGAFYKGTFLQATALPEQAPQASQAEQDESIAIAQERLATGGYRIADMLALAMQQAKAADWACPA